MLLQLNLLFLKGPFSEILSVSKTLFHCFAVKNNNYKLSLIIFNKTSKTRACCICNTCFYPLVQMRFLVEKHVSILPNNFFLEKF